MSAIAGIYYLNSRPVAPPDLERMVDIMAHRGPDGRGAWSKGPVGLGHRMLWTTPESLGEHLPLTTAVFGGCRSSDLAITADARIDNRDELIPVLGLPDRPSGEIADSELILAAYEKWGERCPAKLLGDFAFAIWDERKRMLFCARDPFGVKPFYYYTSDRLFVFASEIKALLCLPEVPCRLNEIRVAYHLEPRLLFQDKTSTFYQGIYRLPPAHALTVPVEGTRSYPYWSWDPERELVLGSDDEYAEAFREIFTETVRCRLRSAYPVGTELSGGLDSSSVTCVARELYARNGHGRLHTFSAIFDEVPESDERPYMHAVVDQGNVQPHFVHVDRLSPLVGLDRLHWLEDQPLFFPNTFLHWGLYRASRQQGVHVLLDGEDGDGIVSYGYGYLSELARAEEWVLFADELKALAQRYDGSFWHPLCKYGLPHLTDLARGFRWAAFARGVRGLSKYLGVSQRNLILNYGLKRLAPEPVRQAWHTLRGRNRSATSPASTTLNPALRRDFVRRIGLGERARAFYETLSNPAQSVREDQFSLITSGAHAFGNEVIDTLAIDFGIELRHPFFDRRLAEFCLALPPQQKLHQGWNRVVMRRAMTNILPERVQWRADKASLTAGFTTGLLKFERERLDALILNESSTIKEYVDVTALREAYRRYVDRADASAAMFVTWPAVTLALWLRHTDLTA